MVLVPALPKIKAYVGHGIFGSLSFTDKELNLLGLKFFLLLKFYLSVLPCLVWCFHVKEL